MTDWLPCAKNVWWFLGVADTNDVIQKIEKTLNNAHTTTQKLTNNSFRNTKKHPNVWMKARRDVHVTTKILRKGYISVFRTHGAPSASLKRKKRINCASAGLKKIKRADQTNSIFSEQDDVYTRLNLF